MLYSFSNDFLLNNYDNLYAFQQKLYTFLYFSNDSLSFIVAILIFISGFLTSLNPCFISVFPLVLSYINAQNKIINKYIFVIGFITSFTLMIIITHTINFYSIIVAIPIFSSIILLLVSLSLLQIIDFSFINKFIFSQTFFVNKYNVYLESYLVGFFMGINIAPCNTSIMFLVTFWLIHSLKHINFFIYFFIYLFGCFIPLLILLSMKIDYKKLYIMPIVLDLLFPLSGSFILSNSLLSLMKQLSI